MIPPSARLHGLVCLLVTTLVACTGSSGYWPPDADSGSDVTGDVPSDGSLPDADPDASDASDATDATDDTVGDVSGDATGDVGGDAGGACDGLPACEVEGSRCDGDDVVRCARAASGCLAETRTACTGGDTCLEDEEGAVCSAGAWPDNGITILDATSGRASLTANFADGATQTSLDWMIAEGVRCYLPREAGTALPYHANHHSLYALSEPVDAWSDVTIRVTPPDNGNAVLYVVEQRATGFAVPPTIDDSTFCYVPQRFGPGEPTEIRFRTYAARNVLFGVANENRFPGDRTGDYDIEVTIEPVEDACWAPVGTAEDGTAWSRKPARYPSHVQRISVDDEGQAVLRGNLSEGAPVCGSLEYLDDATCVPRTQLDRFSGNHVFYAIDGGIPPASIVSITVTPDPGVDVSLYSSFQGAETGFYVPPFYPVDNCDASPDTGAVNPGESESITTWATTNGYEIFFAVAGTAEQGASGGYSVSIDLLTSPGDLCEEDDYAAVTGLDDWPASVETLDASDGFASATLDTRTGEPMCSLAWAANSSTACFPGTENFNFRGNAHYFALDPHPPAGSSVVIRAIPDPDVDASLVAWTTGTTRYVVPPHVPSVGICEASYAGGVGDTTNPGEIEEVEFLLPASSNPYNYFFAVAGPEDPALAGNVTVEVEVFVPPPPHCPESLPGTSYPTWPDTVTQVRLDGDGHGEVSGDLSDGACTNLAFAWDSDVACFTAPQSDRFQGHYVLYAIEDGLPPASEVTITLTPEPGVDVNLWGTQSGTRSFPVPPAISSVLACEASFAYSRANPGEPETIRFSNPTGNTYNIMFAAAGDAYTGTSGGYTIEIDRVTAVPFCEESLPGPSDAGDWPADVTRLVIDDETGEASVTGDVADGSCVNLGFAAESSVACFPATQNNNFQGNQVFFALDEPMPPNSILTLTLQPEDDDVDLNLYGLQVGSTRFPVPPAVPSAVACEASYDYRFGNPGEPESIRFYNPSGNTYNVLAAVSGVTGVTAGRFELTADLEVGEPFCEDSLPGSPRDSWPSQVQRIRMDGTSGSFTGDLDAGECVNLGWASSSQTACFPATMNEWFQGNHRFHVVDRTLRSGETMTVSVEGTNVSLYGYQIGTRSFYVPPYVPTAVACEYSRADESGEITFSNPTSNAYQVFVGVAGTDGVTSGAYTLDVTID